MRFIFLGAPGAGKGTQAERLASKADILHISTGEMLRETAKEKSILGDNLRSLMKDGSLIPDDLMTSILLKRLSEKDAAKGYILDGFPRTSAQAQSLENALSENDEKISGVLYFDLTEETAVERLSGRRTCGKCGKNFHSKFDPPKKEGTCDGCNSLLIQREDDNEETVRNRMRIYRNKTSELINHYDNKNLLYKIDAGKSIKEIETEVDSITEKLR
ncbi:MAG: adenylate kinase [Planctomycetota bacterium]